MQEVSYRTRQCKIKWQNGIYRQRNMDEKQEIERSVNSPGLKFSRKIYGTAKYQKLHQRLSTI